MTEALTIHEVALSNIDSLYQPTHDEYARQRLVGVMRNHAFHNLREDVSKEYETKVAPAMKSAGKQLPTDGHGIDKIMKETELYRFYSTIRYNSQEMMYHSVLDAIERAAPALNAVGHEVAALHAVGGTLRLTPGFEVPRYVTALDVHLAPGCFHSEYTSDDLTQGAMLAQGGRVGAGGMSNRGDQGAVGQSISRWLAAKYPDFKPRRILDIGTQSGKNLLPYHEVYPEAELFGIDVGAPVLRYGHVKAEQEGITVHFSQQNAEMLDFADGYFDLIVSSFFFHEVPVPSTKRIIKECYRLLSNGGMMTHMELPPSKLSGPLLDFMWDWDTKNNNEPSYAAFRAQDPTTVCVDAGFKAGTMIETTIPNWSSFTAEQHEKFHRGEGQVPRHGRGGWFIFGAQKDK